jgi:hypothetical protein
MAFLRSLVQVEAAQRPPVVNHQPHPDPFHVQDVGGRLRHPLEYRIELDAVLDPQPGEIQTGDVGRALRFSRSGRGLP